MFNLIDINNMYCLLIKSKPLDFILIPFFILQKYEFSNISTTIVLSN